MLRCITLVTLATFGPIGWVGLAAQSSSIAQIGDRLRITAPTSGIYRQSGTYRGLRNDMLEFRARGSEDTQRVPVQSITRLETFAGRRGNALNGAAVGALPFALIGMFVYLGDPGDEAVSPDAAIFSALVFGAVGAMVGGLIGAGIKTDRWQPVAPDMLLGKAYRRPGYVGVTLRIPL